MRGLLAGSLLAVGALLGGCASIPRDGGFAEVRETVRSTTGHEVSWDESLPVAVPASDEPVRALLSGELTADTAVRVAFAHNRDVQATLEGLGLARADLIAASTVRNPLLEGELRFPGSPARPFELVFTQTVLDILQLRPRRAAGREQFEGAKLEVSGAVLRFAAEVRADYYQLSAARQVLRHRATMAESAQAAAELALRQHEAGNVSDLDLEAEQTRYEQAKLELSAAALAQRLAEERLRGALGLVETATVIELPPSFDSLPATAPGEASADIDDARIAGRLDVALLRREVEAARRRLPVERAAFLDDLAVGVHREREPDGERTTGPALTVPLPLFDRGAAARGRAVATLRQAEQRLAALVVNARSEIRAARARVAEALARAGYLREVTVPRRRRVVQLTQLAYNAMQQSPFDLLRARRELAGAEEQLVTAERDYWIARNDLDVANQGVARFSVH